MHKRSEQSRPLPKPPSIKWVFTFLPIFNLSFPMASGTEQINVAVGHVNDISHKNRSGINTLMKEVSRFKV